MTASTEDSSGHRGLLWLILAMVVLLVAGLGIDQVASGFRTARRASRTVDPNAVVNGAGLAFRCRDADNCWWLQAIPVFGTWNIVRVIDGDAATLGNLGHVSVASGTTIGVEGRGDRLRFTVNGEVRRSLVDGALRGLHGAGLTIPPGTRVSLAHWDDFRAEGRAGTVTDDFDRPDDARLGSTSTGAWRALDGRWGIRDGQASVVRSVTKGRNLALTDVGADARISVTLTTGAPPRPVVDEFDRPDSPASLGVAPTGQRWRARRGVWGIAGGAAYVSHPDSGGDLALVQGGAADGTVTATIGKVGPGAGIAFRCRGPGNCWRIEAVPRFGTWNVLKVVRNHQVVVANLGTAPVEDGTTIAVDMAGSRLRFFVDGQLQKSLRDADLEDVPGVGLAQSAGRDAATARWDSFGSTPASAHRTDAGTP